MQPLLLGRKLLKVSTKLPHHAFSAWPKLQKAPSQQIVWWRLGVASLCQLSFSPYFSETFQGLVSLLKLYLSFSIFSYLYLVIYIVLGPSIAKIYRTQGEIVMWFCGFFSSSSPPKSAFISF